MNFPCMTRCVGKKSQSIVYKNGNCGYGMAASTQNLVIRVVPSREGYQKKRGCIFGMKWVAHIVRPCILKNIVLNHEVVKRMSKYFCL